MRQEYYFRVIILAKITLYKKLRVLILGYSSLVKRKIIDVLKKNNIKFCVASISSKKKEKKSYNWFRNYDEGLNHSNASLVYISLPNSYHYYWAKKALEKGYHVIVDKPITENLKQAKNLVKIAKKKKRLISEAIFFNYHKQFNEAVKLLNGVKKITHIHANFVIPFPKKNKILISKKFSGGCLMDSGPYAAAIARLFCGGKLIKVNKIITKNEDGLVISLDILCKFTKTTFSGFFCFGGEYTNNLSLFSNNKYIELNRVFSSPTDKKLTILFKTKNILYKKQIEKDDAFNNYLEEILKFLKQKKYTFFYKTILRDSKFREKLL